MALLRHEDEVEDAIEIRIDSFPRLEAKVRRRLRTGGTG